MKEFFTQTITTKSFDWKVHLVAALISLGMLAEFGSHSIRTGKHWTMPILFLALVLSNTFHAYRTRQKMKHCEQSLGGDSENRAADGTVPGAPQG